jgi:hypothetical protein
MSRSRVIRTSLAFEEVEDRRGKNKSLALPGALY